MVCGPPAQARAALEHLLEAATRLCGLTPSGHKFTIYTSDGSSIGTSALAAVEAAVARWTDQAQLDAGKRCVAQADGIVAAGVPIGTMSFSIACLREKVASQERAHAQLRRLGERYTQIAYLLLRYCLVTRFGFWLRTVPPTVLLHVADGAPSVLQSVDSRQRDTLACILTDSDDATADALPALALEQAALPAKRGGVGLISHIAICHAAYVAGYTVALAYMREHHSRLLVTPSAADSDGAPTSDTPALAVLRSAYARLGMQSADGASPLSSLLSGSPRSQHDLSEGVHEKSVDELLARLPSEVDRARVRSCGGQWAGLWLAAAPRSWFARVRGVHYSIALRVRLGVPLRELQPRDGAASVTCGGCGGVVDAFGRHYSSCKNRGGCWTHPHDCVEMSVIRQARLGRARATR